jgi:hypothetical protein
MDTEQLIRRIIERNAMARERLHVAHSSVFESLTTGGELDVDEIFGRHEGERDEPLEGQGASQSVDGDTGGPAAGT